MARVNVERGFRRITMLVSFVALVLGSLVAYSNWSGQRWVWAVHTSQPERPVLVVRVVGLEDFVFCKGTSPREIAESVERLSGSGVRSKGYVACETASPEDSGFPSQKQPVSFVYRRKSQSDERRIDSFPVTRPGYLYSVRELIELESKKELAGDLKAALEELRRENRFPDAEDKPGVRDLARYLALAVGFAALPWIVFFVLRWLVRGFASDSDRTA